jgi:hypothetical protein
MMVPVDGASVVGFQRLGSLALAYAKSVMSNLNSIYRILPKTSEQRKRRNHGICRQFVPDLPEM